MNQIFTTDYLAQFFKTLIYVGPSVVMALSFHEFAHAFVAVRLGDQTPRREGRLSVNPLKHMDLLGTLCLLFLHVGWARPIRVNTRRLKNPRRDMALIALAGPGMNMICAFFGMMIFGLSYKVGNGNAILNYIFLLSYYFAYLNVGLALFNMIPIPPLDGSNVLAEILPGAEAFYQRIRPYRGLILIAMLLFLNRTGILASAGRVVVNRLLMLVKLILGVGTSGTGIV